MDTAALIIEILGGVIAGLAALAGVIGYLKGKAGESLIAALTQSNDQLRNDVNDSDRRIILLTAEVKEEKARREALEKVVTGEKALEEIARILGVHDSRAQQIQQVTNGNYEILERIADKLGVK